MSNLTLARAFAAMFLWFHQFLSSYHLLNDDIRRVHLVSSFARYLTSYTNLLIFAIPYSFLFVNLKVSRDTTLMLPY